MKKSEGQDLKKQVFVVGAGASGLMAAIQAAINGAAVTVLEQNDRPGRKICATGNGRCNMTNLKQDETLTGDPLRNLSKMPWHSFLWKRLWNFFRNWESVPQTAADGSIPEATRHRVW